MVLYMKTSKKLNTKTATKTTVKAAPKKINQSKKELQALLAQNVNYSDESIAAVAPVKSVVAPVNSLDVDFTILSQAPVAAGNRNLMQQPFNNRVDFKNVTQYAASATQRDYDTLSAIKKSFGTVAFTPIYIVDNGTNKTRHNIDKGSLHRLVSLGFLAIIERANKLPLFELTANGKM